MQFSNICFFAASYSNNALIGDYLNLDIFFAKTLQF